MKCNNKHLMGITIFTALYNIIYLFINPLPNPAVPNGFIAINMVIPVVSGYLLGPFSGMVTGALGVGINTLINGSPITATAIFPIIIMGYLAGCIGKAGNVFYTSLTIIIGHILNILFFLRLGLIKIIPGKSSLIILSLLSESAFDIVIIIILATILKNKFFQRERW